MLKNKKFGVRVEIEVKTPGNPHPTQIQASYIDQYQKMGCIAGSAMCLEDVVKIFKDYGIVLYLPKANRKPVNTDMRIKEDTIKKKIQEYLNATGFIKVTKRRATPYNRGKPDLTGVCTVTLATIQFDTDTNTDT